MLSMLALADNGVSCIFCPATFATMADANGHSHNVPADAQIVEFMGQSIAVDANGFPMKEDKGFRCGCCKERHASVKAIRLCYSMTDAAKAIEKAIANAEKAAADYTAKCLAVPHKTYAGLR